MTAPALPSGVGIIAAAAAHGPAIAGLHRRCFDEPWSVFTVRQVLNMPGAFGLLAVPGEGAGDLTAPDLYGFALCRTAARECELLSLAVVPGARGCGIGTALLAAAMDRARNQSVTRMFLEVAEDNRIARQLYERYGFRQIGRRPNYYRRKGQPAATALTYEVALAP